MSRQQAKSNTLFNKDFVDGVVSKTQAALANIERMDDADARIAHYEALYGSLRKIYDDRSPRVIGEEGDKLYGGIIGGMGGLFVGGMVAVIVCPVTLPALAALATFGGGTVAGVAGGSGLASYFGGKSDRTHLRDNYGSVRNARKLFDLKQEVSTRLKREKNSLEILKKSQALNESFRVLNESFDAAAGKKTEMTPVEPVAKKPQMEIPKAAAKPEQAKPPLIDYSHLTKFNGPK